MEGKAGRGRPSKTWYEAVKTDMNVLGVKESEALDREKWRIAVRRVPADPRTRGKQQ